MIKQFLQTTDDFMFSKLKHTFEKVEQSYKNRGIEIDLLKELQSLEFDPLTVIAESTSRFEKDVKFKLKMILGIFFVAAPFIGAITIANILNLGCAFAFVFTFIVAILMASRMDEITSRYVKTRWTEVEEKYNTLQKETPTKPTIYLAGPDVFSKDAKKIAEDLKILCENHGYYGVFPLDNELQASSKSQLAYEIFMANKTMIDSADIVIANLNSFRGKEPDSGTVWEVGYAIAKGKRVFGYMEDSHAYIERFTNEEKTKDGEVYVDKDGMIIEDFGLSANLMIACSLEGIEKDFEAVLQKL